MLTDEQRVLLQNLLGHQIKGIMFHSDCHAHYCKTGDRKLKMAHYMQTLEETENHLDTVCKIICMTGEEIEPAFTQANKLKLSSDPIYQWHEWEEGALACYQKAMEYFPSCRLFKVLVSKVAKEIRKVESLQQKQL